MICDNVCILYIRELGEVCSVEVQPLRQSFHQVRALVSGEGAGGEIHTHTHRAGRQVQMSMPLRDTCSYSAIKMPLLLF